MGQRLNMEIRKKGKVLANCYYHWSAYTGSAYEIASECIDYIKSSDIKDSRLLAIRALESTGAGMNEDDLNYMQNFKKYLYEDFQECRDRNSGILSVCPASIKSTQDWAEGTCILEIGDLNDIRVSFDVLCYYESEQDYIDDHCDDEEQIKNFRDDLTLVDFDDTNMSEKDFYHYIKLMILDEGRYLKNTNGYIMYELG